MSHLRVIVVGLLAAACGGSQGEPVEPAPAPAPAPAATEPADEPDPEPVGETGPPLVARNFEVAPGKFAEVNLQLAAGVTVVAAFRSDGPVTWNVHSHPEDGVAIHQEGTGADGKIEFTPETAGGYSYLWTNEGDSAVNLIISVEVPAGARIVSWVPADAGAAE